MRSRCAASRDTARSLVLRRAPRYISPEFPTPASGPGVRELHPASVARPESEAGRSHGPSIHLSHARPLQGLSGQPEGPGERQSVILSRRKDRSAGRQRLRQIHASAHHGGHRQGVQRRGMGRRGRERRLPPPGAGARCNKERARQRDRGRRPAAGDSRSLQRARHELLGRDRGRDDAAAGRDRGQGPVGSRRQGRSGDGRAALSARRCRCLELVRRRAPAGCSVPIAPGEARPAAPRRADQPPRCRNRSTGWKAICATIPAPSSS